MFLTVGQINIFLAFVFYGIITQLIYCLTHFFVCGKKIKVKKVFADVIFSLIFCVGLLIVNLYTTFGQFLWYTFIALLFGVIICQRTLAPLLDNALQKMYNFTYKAIGKVLANENISKQKNDLLGDNCDSSIVNTDLLANHALGSKNGVSGESDGTAKTHR